MKHLIVIFFILVVIPESRSQSLAGIWEGWFLYPGNNVDTVIMKLDFRLKNDSTYEVYNFTREGDAKSVCKMNYNFVNKNSIYLEEVEIVRTNMPHKNFKLQNMRLKIDKNFKTMIGQWFFNLTEIPSNGKIYFKKKDSES